MHTYNYLALGDSYTVGEQVPLADSFPYQLIQILRERENHHFNAPEIIAQTGWTTNELLDAINRTSLLKVYDFVSLLIGVNNQYRKRSVEDFRQEFESLLLLAIKFAGGNSRRVFVLSIPDWGITPFAAGRETDKIAYEIDAYNLACKEITENRHCIFVDITPDQRTDGISPDFLTQDKLHPSGKEYSKWAYKLSSAILANVQAQPDSP